MKVTSNKVSKTGCNILTASFPVGITCRSDAPCIKDCYGRRGNMIFKNYKNAMQRNLDIYIKSPELYYQCIHLELQMVPYRYFRWFVTGDIPDERFLPQVAVRLAEAHKETKFLMFTKKYELVNEYLDKGKLPQNLTIVLSAWGNFLPQNPHNLPMSYVRFKDDSMNEKIPLTAKECRGKCEDCLMVQEGCWNLRKGESVVFKKH